MRCVCLRQFCVHFHKSCYSNRCNIFVEIGLKKSEPQEGMLFIKISKRLDQLIVRVNRLKNMIVENLKKEEKLVMIIHAQSKPDLFVVGVI